MKGLIGKIETISKEVKADDGTKHNMPFLKISLYMEPSEFPDALSYNGSDIYLSTTNLSGTTTNDEIAMKLNVISDLCIASANLIMKANEPKN